ncbi:MAG: hypothetical protein ABL921_12395 [Pirellula sp.]
MMWISSVVITTNSVERNIERVIESIPAFTLGERFGMRLPIVIETIDGPTSRYWHEWLLALPGVSQVDVVFVSFDDCMAS